VKLTDEEFAKRTAEVLAQESSEPLRLIYLSFADGDGFRGAAIVEAKGILSATLRCNTLGINPGGEVMAIPVPEAQIVDIPEDAKNVLLSKTGSNKFLDKQELSGRW
jgi:hypothetical protein